MQKVQVTILAGGFGTRLQSEVCDRNKVAADIDGRPFITYLLSRLETFEFKEVILCSGYKHDDLSARLGQSYKSLNLVYSKETEPLGTAGALRHALPFFSGDSVVVINGDSYCDLDFGQLLKQHHRRSSSSTLSAVWIDDVQRYGRLVIDSNGKVNGFIEKDRYTGPGFINAGIYVIENGLIESMPAGRSLSLEKEIFPQWAKQEIIDAFFHSGHFIDIGTVESYKKAQSYIRSKYRFNPKHPVPREPSS